MNPHQVSTPSSSSGSSPVTLDSLKEHNKIIIQQLRDNIQNIMKKKEGKIGVDQDIYDTLEKKMSSLELWSGKTPKKITETNIKQVDAIFDEIEKLLRQKTQNAKTQMVGKTDEQQKQLIEHYAAFAQFFNDLMSALGDIMDKIKEGVKAGLVIDSKLVKQLFQDVLQEVHKQFI